MTLAIRREFDDKKRQAMVHDLQRYEATKMYNEKVAGAGGFNLTWPVVRNIYVQRGGTNWMDVEYLGTTGLKAYLDPTQAPLKKA